MRPRTLLRPFKHALTVVASHVPGPWLHQMQMVVNYMILGRWMHDRGFEVARRSPTREGVFEPVARQVADKRTLYLEFGVYQGVSMRYWSRALAHPEAALHGFDSFEGLPEDFDLYGRYPKRHFDTGGVVPQIDDARVRFFKGWYRDTLPAYRVPAHEALVINIDSDLYTSAVCVLDHLRPHIVPGTFLYFDDLCRPEHELKAFDEFMRDTGRKFRLIAADSTLTCSFFECVA